MMVGRGEGCKQKTQELSLILNSFLTFRSRNLSGLSLFSSFVCKSSFARLISHGMTDVYISLVPSLGRLRDSSDMISGSCRDD